MSNFLIKNTATKNKLLEVLDALNFCDDDLSKMDECIDEFITSIPTEDEKCKTVLSIHRQAENLARRLLCKYVEGVETKFRLLEDEKRNYKQELQQQAMSNPPKMVFTTSDILDITQRYNIKGKTTRNTIQSHIEKGILKATKDENGYYQIKRVDLEEYLGFKDF